MARHLATRCCIQSGFLGALRFQKGFGEALPAGVEDFGCWIGGRTVHSRAAPRSFKSPELGICFQYDLIRIPILLYDLPSISESGEGGGESAPRERLCKDALC